MPAKKNIKSKNGNGATLGIENELWEAADKLRGHLDAAEYKNVVLGHWSQVKVSLFLSRQESVPRVKDVGSCVCA